MAFNPIGPDYVSRNFNDRRIKGPKVMWPDEAYTYTPKGKEFKKHQFGDGDTPGYGTGGKGPAGGSSVPRKPKPKVGPKNPFGIALKTGAHK